MAINYKVVIFFLCFIFSTSVGNSQGDVLDGITFSSILMNYDKRGVVKTEDGSYLMYMSIPAGGVTIGGQFIEKLENPPEIPDSPFNNDMVIFKLSADMDLLAWNQVLNFSNNFKITGSDNKVFIKHSNTSNSEPFIVIGDELLEFAPGQSSVFMFDDELNFEGELFSIDNLISNIVADDSFLYATALMNEQDTLVTLEQDTVNNFKRTITFMGEEISLFVQRAETIIKYDYNNLSLDTMWRIGSTQGETISKKLKLDNAGNLVMIGKTGTNFIHSDVDTVNVAFEDSPRGQFWAKFNPSSELQIIDFQEQVELSHYYDFHLDEMDDVYLLSTFGGDSLVIGNQVFYNYQNPELDQSTSRTVLIKFDGNNGDIQWARSLQGYMERNGDHYVSIKNGICTLVGSFDGDLPVFIQSSVYDLNGQRAHYIANLNADDGSEISHFVHLAEGHQAFVYVENSESPSIKRLIAEFGDSGEFLDIPVGTENITLFLEIDFDFFTSIKEAQNTDALLKAYPNPIGDDDQLHVELTINSKVDWALYSTTGALLQEGNLINPIDLFTIDLSAYTSGVYVLQLRSSGLIQNQLIIKP